ncbi:MAG: hypothetical protein ABIQ44_02900 [Chloroflexia bacterium]
MPSGQNPTSSTRPTLLIFQGGASASNTPLERLVIEAQNASTLDLLLTASHTNAFHNAILVTEDPLLSNAAQSLPLPNLPLITQSTNKSEIQSFSFGTHLHQIVQSHNLDRVVYIGGGAMPLATPTALSDLALSVSGPGECVMSNNLFSADMVAFYPASALSRIALPENDNDLAWLLHYRAGLPNATAIKSLATNFDIDTPTDLATLWYATSAAPLNRSIGPYLTAFLQTVPQHLPTLADHVERAYKVMSTRRAQLFLSGRVSSWTWRRMEINLPCQTRVLSEERGMRASGKETGGGVRSLLGLYTDLAGIDGLISMLETTSDAAFLDTRVLFAHNNLHPARPERFASDSFSPTLADLPHPWINDLTQAAAASKIPIVLGGHSLIAGGMWLLSERVRTSASSAAS